MTLEFLAFWLATPEILGEERLRALERRAIGEWPYVLRALVTTLIMVPMFKFKPKWLWEWKWELSTWLLVLLAGFVLLLLLAVSKGIWRVVGFLLALATTVCVLALTGWTNERVWMILWLAWSIVLATILALMIEQKAAPYILRILADRKRIRQRSFVVGAVLFVVGFLLQFIATF